MIKLNMTTYITTKNVIHLKCVLKSYKTIDFCEIKFPSDYKNVSIKLFSIIKQFFSFYNAKDKKKCHVFLKSKGLLSWRLTDLSPFFKVLSAIKRILVIIKLVLYCILYWHTPVPIWALDWCSLKLASIKGPYKTIGTLVCQYNTQYKTNAFHIIYIYIYWPLIHKSSTKPKHL